MLTKLAIRNFKRFDDVEIELDNPVVFVGPNNSGKTSAMQALALWYEGLKCWNDRRSGKGSGGRGVTMNRLDLTAIPHPRANLLWHECHTRNVTKGSVSNVRIDIIVEGVTGSQEWECGLEFDYANEESLYCRPLRLSKNERMPVPGEARNVQIAFLPPMSGLAATETRIDHGAVNVRIGEGRTAEVLRNLCYSIAIESDNKWKGLVEQMKLLFGVTLEKPNYVEGRGEITMGYRERWGKKLLDLSSSGSGLQQTLLLLAYMAANPDAVILLDEPDAHLEILRQREIYRLLTETARTGGNQIIAATHSEVLLDEAADKDTVIAFVGKPHRVEGYGQQVRKVLDFTIV